MASYVSSRSILTLSLTQRQGRGASWSLAMWVFKNRCDIHCQRERALAWSAGSWCGTACPGGPLSTARSHPWHRRAAGSPWTAALTPGTSWCWGKRHSFRCDEREGGILTSDMSSEHSAEYQHNKVWWEKTMRVGCWTLALHWKA